MNKVLYGLLIGILTGSLAGCVTVKKVVRGRVDQDISGNQGYIQGGKPSIGRPQPKSREYIDIKVEIPTWEEVKERLPEPKAQKRKPIRPTEDRDITGNRGYITGGRGFEEELPPVYKPEPVVFKPVEPAPAEYEELEEVVTPELVVPEEIMVTPRTYKVKEGDTLSHIAKNFYGKASKWTIIYEANSDKIKDPNRVKVGTMLVIPELEEAESKYVK